MSFESRALVRAASRGGSGGDTNPQPPDPHEPNYRPLGVAIIAVLMIGGIVNYALGADRSAFACLIVALVIELRWFPFRWRR